MNFINKILLEATYEEYGDKYNYYKAIPPYKIKQKAEYLSDKFNGSKVKQSKTGSCYFVLFDPTSPDHFIWEIRLSDHPPNKKSDFYQTIELSYFQSLSDMIKIIKDKVYSRNFK